MTTYFENKMRTLMETTTIIPVYNKFNENDSISSLQNKIEGNFITLTHNSVIAPHDSHVLIIIDDLNLPLKYTKVTGILRSLVEHHGWYSNAKSKYL